MLNFEAPQDEMHQLAQEHDPWQKAEDHFSAHSKSYKLPKRSSHLMTSFLKTKSNIFIYSTLLGRGKYRKAKLIETRDGNKVTLLIEKRQFHQDDLNEYNVLRHLGLSYGLLACKHKPKIYKLMKYYEGVSLFDILYDQNEADSELVPCDNLSIVQKLIIAIKACQELQAIHLKRVIHQDIKPQNIIVKIDGNKINVGFVDFGFSKLLGDNERYYRNIKGLTLDYAAPECVSQRAAIFASDVYSLGKLFFCDLRLPLEICEDMIYPNFKLRPSLDAVILRLVEVLKEESELDCDACDVIRDVEEMSIFAPFSMRAS